MKEGEGDRKEEWIRVKKRRKAKAKEGGEEEGER